MAETPRSNRDVMREMCLLKRELLCACDALTKIASEVQPTVGHYFWTHALSGGPVLVEPMDEPTQQDYRRWRAAEVQSWTSSVAT